MLSSEPGLRRTGGVRKSSVHLGAALFSFSFFHNRALAPVPFLLETVGWYADSGGKFIVGKTKKHESAGIPPEHFESEEGLLNIERMTNSGPEEVHFKENTASRPEPS